MLARKKPPTGLWWGLRGRWASKWRNKESSPFAVYRSPANRERRTPRLAVRPLWLINHITGGPEGPPELQPDMKLADRSKRYRSSVELIDRAKTYSLAEAVETLKK